MSRAVLSQNYFKQFPFKVKYQRTNDWYTSRWYDLSTWCNEMCEIGSWEYTNEQFLFKKQEDQILFVLRWS
jgi:hypothetical protein